MGKQFPDGNDFSSAVTGRRTPKHEGENMEELIKQVAAKAGISEDQARSATTTVLDFVKTRLPEPIAGQIDNVIGGGAGVVGDLANTVGGLFK
jgi:hypothetical protein